MFTLTDALTVAGLLNALKNPHSAVRRHAVQALGKHKLDAPLALRQFTRGLSDADPLVRISAVRALKAVGSAAVLALAQALADPDREVRREAAWALGQVGPEAEPALDALCDALHDPDLRVRQGATRALGLIGPGARAAAPLLTGLLHEANILLCRLAAWSLVRIGAGAVGHLVHVLLVRDPFVRCEAAWALGQMGPQAAAAVPALVAVLRSDEARCLCKADGAPTRTSNLPPTTPIFLPPRKGSLEGFFLLVIKALGAIGADAHPAVAELRQLRQTGNGTAQLAATEALGQIDPTTAG